MAVWKEGLKKVGRYYQYRFFHRGERVQGSTKCETMAAAREWLKAKKEALALAEQGIHQAPDFKGLAEGWLRAHAHTASPNHHRNAQSIFEQYLIPALGSLELPAVSTTEVEAIRIAYLEADGHTIGGWNFVLRYLNLLFGWALKQGFIGKKPYNVSPIRTQRKPRVFVPRAKLGAFLAALDAKKNLHQSIAIRAMVLMGLRESEALGMRWEWFDMDERTYTPGKTKGKEAVTLPVPDEICTLLGQLKQLSEWVLPAGEGGPHNRNFTRRFVQDAGKAIGIEGLSPHRLRGTFATLMSKQVDPFTLRTLMRHKELKTTLGYVEADLCDAREAQRKLLLG